MEISYFNCFNHIDHLIAINVLYNDYTRAVMMSFLLNGKLSYIFIYLHIVSIVQSFFKDFFSIHVLS